MTLYFVNLMWAIVLFGVLLWTTACVALNAALRRGMRAMGMALSYGILVVNDAGILPADTRREQHGDDGAAPVD
jgi:heme A synthase